MERVICAAESRRIFSQLDRRPARSHACRRHANGDPGGAAARSEGGTTVRAEGTDWPRLAPVAVSFGFSEQWAPGGQRGHAVSEVVPEVLPGRQVKPPGWTVGHVSVCAVCRRLWLGGYSVLATWVFCACRVVVLCSFYACRVVVLCL